MWLGLYSNIIDDIKCLLAVSSSSLLYLLRAPGVVDFLKFVDAVHHVLVNFLIVEVVSSFSEVV